MTTKLLLDTNILSRICHPSRFGDVKSWLLRLLAEEPPVFQVYVSAASHYELLHGLARIGAKGSFEFFKRLTQHLVVLPITAMIAERAAEFPLPPHQQMTSGRQSLSDIDLLIFAQALDSGAILVSSDRALTAMATSIGIDARDWQEISSTSRHA